MVYQTRMPEPGLREIFRTPLAAPAIPGRWIASALACSGCVVAAMLMFTGIVIIPENRGFAAAGLPIALLLAARIGLRQPHSLVQRQIRDFCEYMLVFLTIALLGVFASYAAAAQTSGFADPALQRIDLALHFDWLAWYRAVCSYRVLQYVGSAAYDTIYVSPIVLLAYFARVQSRFAAHRFLLTFWLGVLLTIVLFPLVPAAGPLAYLWHGPIPYMPTSALYQEQMIPALRAHLVRDIDLGALRGLVCAPSFHTVSAVLYITAAWPVRTLRWLIVPLNLAMLLATPVEGTHYLIDMIAGLLVAIVATFAAKAVLYLVERRQAGARSGRA
jgi:membrane-associated phospholipid phosphatase